MPTRLDENNTCIAQGNGGRGLCPHASTKITPIQYKEMEREELCPHPSTRITPVQYKEMGGGSYAHTPRRE